MQQPSSPVGQVTVNGKTYRLNFALIAVASLKDLWQMESEDEVLARVAEIETNWRKGKHNFAALTDYFWASLQRYHPEITPKEAREMLDDLGLDGMPTALNECFRRYWAGAPPQGARQARPPKAKNGASVSTS